MKGKLLRKVASVSVALSMVALTAGPVMGQTIEDLLAQIAALQAQLVALQGGGAAYSFTRDLYEGLSGADVTALQNYLKTGGYFTATATGFYGPITKAAVAAWQAANGVSPAAGYFGAISRAKYVALAGPAAPPAPVAGLQGGEGDFRNFEVLGDPSSENASEGESNLKVLGVQFEADGSDLKIERMEVIFSLESGANNHTRPWYYFKNVSLYRGSDKIASKDADTSGDWSELDDETVADTGAFKDYKMTFTGLNEIVEEGDEEQFYVAVSMADAIDSNDEDGIWGVHVPVDGIRAVDAAGINQYAHSSVSSQTINFEAVTVGNLIVSYDANENKSRVVEVDNINDTNGVEILAFTMKADDGDVLVTDVAVDLVATLIDDLNGDMVKRLALYRNGSLVKTEVVPDVSVATATVTFDDVDFTIDAEDTDDFVIKADFQDTEGTGSAAFDNADTLAADIDAADVTAETSQGLAASVTGSAVGGTLSAYDSGIRLALVSKSAVRSHTATDSSSDPYDQGTYTIKFDVTAFGGDMYVQDGALASTTVLQVGNDNGAQYDVMNSDGTANAAVFGTATAAFTSSATAGVNSNFKIPEGQTKEFTLVVTATASSADAYIIVGLESVGYAAADQSTSTVIYTAGLDTTWRTDAVLLNKLP